MRAVSPSQKSKKPGSRAGREGGSPTKASGDDRNRVARARINDVRETYGKMSAEARGVRIHNGPLVLRQSLPPRDCTSWVREDKQYCPYSYFESASNKPTPLPEKSKGPAPLWLREDAKPKVEAKAKASEDPDQESDDEDDKEGAKVDFLAALKQQPPWDSEHHIMVSRMNHQVQVGVREYFDVPKRKESEGIPKMRERFAMNDRACTWNDLPKELGESRRTLFDELGPYNLGGCKQQQLPSYWRKIRDWGSYSQPNLGSLSGSKSGPQGTQGTKDKKLLIALANTPASQAAAFWKEWAEQKTPAEFSVKKTSQDSLPKNPRWDRSWNITPSKDNQVKNPRQREYFSIPAGGTGRAIEGPRTLSSSIVNPLAVPAH